MKKNYLGLPYPSLASARLAAVVAYSDLEDVNEGDRGPHPSFSVHLTDEWSSGVRLVWLLLLCLVLLIVFTVLFGHVCSCSKFSFLSVCLSLLRLLANTNMFLMSSEKPKNNPGGQNFTGQRLNGSFIHGLYALVCVFRLDVLNAEIPTVQLK